jgi:hypothetical protein
MTAYAELHCKTNFSFLQGASHPDELVKQAAELGYRALAITDHNSLAGVVRAHTAAKAAGLKLLIGAEITPIDAAPVRLFAPDFPAYRRLSRLITQGRRAATKGECVLRFEDIATHAEGLLAVVVLPPSPPLRGRGEKYCAIAKSFPTVVTSRSPCITAPTTNAICNNTSPSPGRRRYRSSPPTTCTITLPHAGHCTKC